LWDATTTSTDDVDAGKLLGHNKLVAMSAVPLGDDVASHWAVSVTGPDAGGVIVSKKLHGSCLAAVQQFSPH